MLHASCDINQYGSNIPLVFSVSALSLPFSPLVVELRASVRESRVACISGLSSEVSKEKEIDLLKNYIFFTDSKHTKYY